MSKFFRLYFDDNETRWQLRVPWEEDGQRIDVWSYVSCRRGQREPRPRLRITRTGNRTEFNFAGPECVPAVSARVADEMERVAPDEFERISVTAEDGTPLEIINILKKVDCLDHRKSIGEYYPTTHHKTPGIEPRAGQISHLIRMVIDPTRTEGANLFRISDWRIAVMASENLVNALRDAKVTGIVFQPILTDAPLGKMLIRRGKELVPWPADEREVWLASQKPEN